MLVADAGRHNRFPHCVMILGDLRLAYVARRVTDEPLLLKWSKARHVTVSACGTALHYV